MNFYLAIPSLFSYKFSLPYPVFTRIINLAFEGNLFLVMLAFTTSDESSYCLRIVGINTLLCANVDGDVICLPDHGSQTKCEKYLHLQNNSATRRYIHPYNQFNNVHDTIIQSVQILTLSSSLSTLSMCMWPF